jgi:NitT/TauT family transport system substrate-binding protein
VVDAFREATNLINTDHRRVAEIYSADTGGKETVAETEQQLADPEFIFDLGPKKLIKLTDFMNASGTIKGKPTSWKEMFFPEVHDLSGD